MRAAAPPPTALIGSDQLGHRGHLDLAGGPQAECRAEDASADQYQPAGAADPVGVQFGGGSFQGRQATAVGPYAAGRAAPPRVGHQARIPGNSPGGVTNRSCAARSADAEMTVEASMVRPTCEPLVSSDQPHQHCVEVTGAERPQTQGLLDFPPCRPQDQPQPPASPRVRSSAAQDTPGRQRSPPDPTAPRSAGAAPAGCPPRSRWRGPAAQHVVRSGIGGRPGTAYGGHRAHGRAVRRAQVRPPYRRLSTRTRGRTALPSPGLGPARPNDVP